MASTLVSGASALHGPDFPRSAHTHALLTGLNFIVTTHKLRTAGLTWFRLPLFVWSLYATSLILVLASPVLAITLALMSVERFGGVGISIRSWAATRFSFSTSSGSIPIRRFMS